MAFYPDRVSDSHETSTGFRLFVIRAPAHKEGLEPILDSFQPRHIIINLLHLGLGRAHGRIVLNRGQ